MYFYPKAISTQAIQVLQEQGLELVDGEMFIPDEESEIVSEDKLVFRGVQLVRKQKVFKGHLPRPKVWSSLEGDLVPTGRDMVQCEICGFWLSDKPSPQDEKQHNQQCRPAYEWRLA